jgi:hypothetical protein
MPLNILVDLRTMQIYGRLQGAVPDRLILERSLRELAEEPQWAPDGTRIADFSCGLDDRTEVEPNGWDDTPEDGRSLPFTMSGTICPPNIADGFVLDEDFIDLGTLAAGTVIDVEVSREPGSGVYPWVSLRARTEGGPYDSIYLTYGPAMLDVESGGRQWVIHSEAHYYVAVHDGRLMSHLVYSRLSEVPPGDRCCRGGPDHTYTVVVSSPALAATEPPLVMGYNDAVLEGGIINVHPFAARAGTSYSFRMIADNTERLDPYLIVVNAHTGEVLGYNDDEYYPTNRNSLVRWTATADTNVFLVASYFGAWFFPDSPPAYTVRIQ